MLLGAADLDFANGAAATGAVGSSALIAAAAPAATGAAAGPALAPARAVVAGPALVVDSTGSPTGAVAGEAPAHGLKPPVRAAASWAAQKPQVVAFGPGTVASAPGAAASGPAARDPAGMLVAGERSAIEGALDAEPQQRGCQEWQHLHIPLCSEGPCPKK